MNLYSFLTVNWTDTDDSDDESIQQTDKPLTTHTPTMVTSHKRENVTTINNEDVYRNCKY